MVYTTLTWKEAALTWEWPRDFIWCSSKQSLLIQTLLSDHDSIFTHRISHSGKDHKSTRDISSQYLGPSPGFPPLQDLGDTESPLFLKICLWFLMGFLPTPTSPSFPCSISFLCLFAGVSWERPCDSLYLTLYFLTETSRWRVWMGLIVTYRPQRSSATWNGSPELCDSSKRETREAAVEWESKASWRDGSGEANRSKIQHVMTLVVQKCLGSIPLSIW